MTFFMKKRPDLPKQPDPSQAEGFGLFVQRDPKSGEETEILANNEPVRQDSRRTIDVQDVETVDIIDVPVQAQEQPAPQEEQEAEPAPAAPSHVPGLRASRRPRAVIIEDDDASPAAPAAAPEPVTPVEPVAPVLKSRRPSLDDLARPSKPAPAKQPARAAAPVREVQPEIVVEEPVTVDEPVTPAPAMESETAQPAFSGLKIKKAVPASEPISAPESAPEAPEVPAAAKRSLSGLWSRSKGDKQAEAAPEVSGTKKKADKAEKPAKPTKEEKAAAKAAAKSAASSKGKKERKAAGTSQLDLLVELDAERRVFWRVTADSLTQLTAEDVSQAASFSGLDNRYPTTNVLKYNQARDLALSEIGEDCRIVNATKAMRAVYGTKATRVDSLKCEIGPGVALVEHLLVDHDHAARDLIVGLLLTDEGSTKSLAILFHVNKNGDFSPPQVTVNPDNLSFTLSQFANSKRLIEDDADVLLFKNAELLAVAGALQYYPNELVWNGVPVRKILWGAAMVSSVAAFVAAGYAGQAYMQKHALESEQVALTAQVKKIDAELKSSISSSLVSFAQTQTVDVKQVSGRAAQLWVPYSKVTLEATATLQRYDILMPLTRGGLFNNRPSVLGQLAARDVEPLIGMAAPDGCTKDIPGVSGAIDAIQITISCESDSRPVHRYRTD